MNNVALRRRALRRYPEQRGRIDVILYDLLTDEEKKQYRRLIKNE
jgi:hypothetical protein